MEKELLEMLELDDVEIDFDNVQKDKKKRVVRKGVLFTFIIITVIALVTVVIVSPMFKLKTVNISGNKFLTDEEIIEYGNIHINNSIFIAYMTEIETNIEAHDIVKNVKIDYKNGNELNIVVEEEPVLFSTNNGVYLTSSVFVKTDVFSPVVDFENFNDVKKKDEVLEELARLYDEAPEVYEFISQISFAPDSVTDDRIMIRMRDTNTVYLSTNQICDKMSKYFAVVDSIYSEYGVTYGVLSFDKGGEFKSY